MLVKIAFLFLALGSTASIGLAADQVPADEPLPQTTPGPFEPTWQSLSKYRCPDWFRDAKFGIWAHWSAQCVPEQGDWYARNMYFQHVIGKDGSVRASHDYDYQVAHYGHPSKVGMKDLDNLWHAEHWDPQDLISLYKRAGAQYFMMLGNHHDNFDNWNSTYQPWNAVKVGPHKDLVGGWQKAAKEAGMHFGVSIHAARSWDWFDVSHGADTDGPLKGVSYDGNLTLADGKGLWWEGLDPVELYGPAGGARTKQAKARYDRKFYNRVIQLIDDYQPDLIYFDDSRLPISDEVGLNIAAHFYNTSAAHHDGHNEAVINTKSLNAEQRKCLVLDIERGVSPAILPQPWQADTCIGQWHYNRALYDRDSYKSAVTVTQMLVDIVSKNGNLMLSVPVRPDGTIDEKERKIVTEIGDWMAINQEAIFGTRPWVIAGEGPQVEAAAKAGPATKPQNFNEGKVVNTAQDIRFTTHGNTLYVMPMIWPADGKLTIKTLKTGSDKYTQEIESVELLGSSSPVKFERTAEGLVVTGPTQAPSAGPCVIKVTPKA
jgi:alpha-L-fucosidase